MLVPAAAERPDQCDGALVLRRAHLQRLAAVTQLAALRVEQLELADVARTVARVGQRSRAARRGDGTALGLCLRAEQPERRKLILHVLERDQHLLAILGDGAVELGARRVDAGPAPAAVEE